MNNIGVSTPVAGCGVETPFGAVAQKEDSMEFLVEFGVEVPAQIETAAPRLQWLNKASSSASPPGSPAA